MSTWKCLKTITIPLKNGSNWRVRVVDSRGVWVLLRSSPPGTIFALHGFEWSVFHGPTRRMVAMRMREEIARATLESVANACPNIGASAKRCEKLSDDDIRAIEDALNAVAA